ncbi:hypothetical protein AT959_09200 [Dechloromonas denitrificans]|uniref:Uncharacterized protein n=1 Tax=Dechloromonas denitrificans TaxID=281362 RepID=A0A133XIW7_9RHOO|nr:hypothetical protein [Dechloromonas denitrificans]KXB30884.1 hypothetical protein AT959_09200 [Dechloromonas denitrificans]
MSDVESAPAAAKQSNPNKLLIILIGCALALSLVNTVLLVLNPTASKVEAFNESLKTDLAESIASVHKKVDGLRSAEIEWQAVLKKASEKPAATYKIVKSGDGLLTLTEIEAAAPMTAETAAQEPKK